MMQITGELPQMARSLELISPWIGIVNAFRKAHLLHSDPAIVAYSATTADAGALTDSFKHLASGAGLTWSDAFLATMGEAVERYSSSFYKKESLRFCSANDLPAGSFIAPESFALFAEQQYEMPGFPFSRFNRDLPVHWDEAMDLVDGRYKYVPAAFLYMPFGADPNPITEQISTGFAVHSDPYLATLSAICEVIERDSFMIAWANRLPLPRLHITGGLKQFVDSILPANFELSLLDMTTDLGVPSVMGIMKGTHDYGDFIVVCAAARPDMFSAAQKTVIELSQSIPYFRNLLEQDRTFEDFSEVKTFADHSVFYLKRKDLWDVFDPFFESSPSVIVPEPLLAPPAEKLLQLVKALDAHGHPVMVKDKTTPDIQAAGYRLVRAVCPGLIHLNGTYGQYYLGGKRIYEVPRRMGFNITNTYETLNHLPHPFP